MERNAPDLRETFGVIWRHKLMIATIIVVSTLGALGVSTAQHKVFDASSYLVVRPVVAPASFSGSSSGREGPLGRDVSIQSNARIAASALVAERVRTKLDLNETAADLSAAVNVSVLTDEILRVTARSDSPELAQALANTFASEYLAYEREAVFRTLSDLAKDLTNRVRVMERRAAQLDARFIELSVVLENARGRKGSDTEVGTVSAEMERVRVERNEILTRLGQMRARSEDLHATLNGSPGGGEILQEAVLPTKASRPVPARDSAIGFLLGLMLGIGAAFIRYHVDDRIRSTQDVASATGVPVLGAIPRAKRWRRKREAYLAMLGEPGSPAAEGFRSLRQSLTATGVGRGLKSVLVTSGSKGAGKSATAANLGVAFAQAGLRAVVLSADFRRPRVHSFFGMANDGGLSEVLRGEKSLDDAILSTAIPNLWVIPSGALPRNPAALLDGPRLRETIEALVSMADVVIIDGPSIASGADAFVLAPYADISLLTMRREFARSGGSTAAVGGLKQAGAERIGAVLTMALEPRESRSFDIRSMALPVPSGIAGAGEATGSNGHAVNGNGHAANGHTNGHQTSNGHTNGAAAHANGSTPVAVVDGPVPVVPNGTKPAQTRPEPKRRRTTKNDG